MIKKQILAVSLALFSCSLQAKDKEPNVILVFVDDFGYGDLACYGNPYHRTPVFDNMAKEGVKLTDFYVGSSVSSPSRSALLTGSYPKRVSMHVNADPLPLMGKSRQVLFPISMKGLNPSEVTIAEMLRANGYKTACIGKWHLGDQLAFLPTRQGFDYFYGLPYSHDMDKDYCPLPMMEQERVVEAPVKPDSLTYKLTRKAVSFIRSNKKEPFFLYLAHGMTHKPLDASPRFKGKSKNGLYGDAVEELDWSMGELFKTLREEGLDNHTIVIFASDNGAAKGAGGSNKPLRDWKASTYEGGFRVPCLIRYPGVIPANTVCSDIITAMDIMPTVAGYCRAKLPSDRKLDGLDVSSLIEGKQKKIGERVFYYYQRNQLQAVRYGKWKYHLGLEKRLLNAASDKMEASSPSLYNLERDIAETHNVVNENPEIERIMKKLISDARQDLGDWNFEGKGIRPAGVIDEPFGRFLLDNVNN